MAEIGMSTVNSQPQKYNVKVKIDERVKHSCVIASKQQQQQQFMKMQQLHGEQLRGDAAYVSADQ
jgi:hypothetical protein